MDIVTREKLSEPEKAKPTELNIVQRETLVALGDGAARMFTYKGVLTARALVTRGYAKKVNEGDGKWWIRITDAGREKLATMSHGMAVAP